jgi:hypothetical protein
VLLHSERLERRVPCVLGNTRRSVGGIRGRRGWDRTERDTRITSDAGAYRFNMFLIISGAIRSIIVWTRSALPMFRTF